MSRPARALTAGLILGLVTATGCAAPPGGRSAFEPDSSWEAYARPTAALMWPGATRAFQITPAGNLYDGAWVVRIEPDCDGQTARPPRAIAFEERWLPVAHWTRRSGDVRWDFEALALPAPAPGDSGLMVSLSARATNRGGATHRARLVLTLAPPGDAEVFRAPDADGSGARFLAWGAGGAADTVCGWRAGATRGPEQVEIWSLEPGTSRSTRIVLTAYPEPARRLAGWARTPHEERAREVRDFWNRRMERGTRFELGDPATQAAVKAARVLLLCCRERHGGTWTPIGGPFQYRDVWLRDGARVVHALAISGETDAARELAEGLLGFQWMQGPFLSQRGQLDGTGQALWAFEQALLRPGPAAALAPFADAAARAWRWCEEQRRLGIESKWPVGRMLPFGDPRDAELVRAQLVGNDAWCIAGYHAAERLLRAASRSAEADSVAATRARYLADFVAQLERTPGPDVPPSWQGVGRDWGNLAVGWPCGTLPPRSPRLAALARRVWSAAGGAGLATYGSRDSLHSYVGADLGTWALLAGRRAQADSVLEAMMRWRNGSGGAAEIFSRSSRDYGVNLPPHPTAAAALIALVRNMTIFDDDDTLRLTLGARDRWWRGARVLGAPTWWGNLNLEFAREGGSCSWTWTPVPVWTALTLPAGTRPALPLPAPLLPGAAGTVLAPPGTRHAQVALSPSGSAQD